MCSTGEIRSQISDGAPAKVYKAGEFFFEPPGSSHLVSENASATEPASLLAVFVAADDATLTAPGEVDRTEASALARRALESPLHRMIAMEGDVAKQERSSAAAACAARCSTRCATSSATP